ncbi:MAG: hypothetical protein A2138_05440 [Deltaproteobacteria bacterium RBG_16_71_12]|nr:MAG: hypothetical protein A2138_05440 [Deltaproteobacteria bacterium RBG_16_71_12]
MIRRRIKLGQAILISLATGAACATADRATGTDAGRATAPPPAAPPEERAPTPATLPGEPSGPQEPAAQGGAATNLETFESAVKLFRARRTPEACAELQRLMDDERASAMWREKAAKLHKARCDR